MGLRQPVHDLHRLQAPGLRQVPGPDLLAADEPGADQPVLRQEPHAGGGPRADREPGQRDRDRGRHQPRGEGDQPDRPPALRGVHQGLHRQAVADRPDQAERRDHHSAAGSLHLRERLVQRHLRGAADRRLHRVADEDGRPPQHRGAARDRLPRPFVRHRRRSSRARSRSSTPARSTSTSATARAASRGGPSTSSSRSRTSTTSRAPASSTTTTRKCPTPGSSSSSTSTPSG